MAGEWIKMRADLFTHPKVFRIAEALGKDELYVVGALLSFWSWADKHSVDGYVDGATSQLVDRATRVDGLAVALVTAGWLEVTEHGVSIPRFSEHNSESAKDRSLKNQRQARWRERKAAGLVDTAVDGNTSTNPSTREEKRREENKEQKITPSGDTLFAGVSPQVATDFKALRSRLRAPITPTAVAGIRREAAKAGIEIDAALTMCCERGWRGFKSEWVNGLSSRDASPAPRKRVDL